MEPKTYRHARLGTMVGNIVNVAGDKMYFKFSEEQVISDGEGGVELYEAGETVELKNGSLKEVKNPS